MKVRFEPKGFAWCTPKPDGGYDYHKPDRVPVYNAPVLAKAQFVYLVEGEKDVDTLTQNGIPAVSLPDGAMQGKWPDGYTNCFIGKVVIILPDNDDVGIAYTAELYGTCWLLIDTLLSSRPYSLARHRVRGAGHTRCKAVDLPRPDTPTTEKELPPPIDAARALPCISA